MTPSDEVLCQWYEARDIFLGINYYRRDHRKGLSLAQRVADKVPEAAWLCSLFRDGECDINIILTLLHEQHERGTLDATCYLGILHPFEHARKHYENQAWDQGHPLTCGFGWITGTRIEGEHMCVNLAARGCSEPSVLYAAAVAKRYEVEYLKRAVNLGLVDAFCLYARITYVRPDPDGFETRDPLYYYWEGRAAQRGRNALSFMEEASEWLLKFLRGETSSAHLVQIEAMFEGYLSPKGQRLMRSTSRFSPQATGHYITVLCRAWREDARRAVNMWLLIGRRTRGMNRDMRRTIGRRIWDEWLRDVEYMVRTPDDCPIIITRDGEHTAPPCIMTRSSAMCQQLIG
jgi:hypothetical protein